MTRQTVRPEDDEVVDGKEDQYRGCLVRDREHAHPQLDPVRQERDEEESQCVLPERHAAQDVEEKTCQPRIPEPRDARAGEDPVDDGEQRQIRAQGIEPVGQRNDREDESRRDAAPVAEALRERALPHGTASGAAAPVCSCWSCGDSNQTSSTSRSRSSWAVGRASTSANVSAGVRSTRFTSATG